MGTSFPSIFNNVVGPIMRGPSSSHTAAAVRIGLLARRLLDEQPRQVVATFDPDGSLASTYRGQGSAMGLAAGLLQMDISDSRMVDAERICREQDIEVLYRIAKLAISHPNTYHLAVKGAGGAEISLVALSTGGGIIRLVELNGEAVVDDSIYVHPLLPIQPQGGDSLPFATPEELENLLAGQGGSLSRWASAYEAALGKIDVQRVVELGAEHFTVMKDSVASGLAGTNYNDRILPRQSDRIASAQQQGLLIPSKLVNSIIASVTAVMETKSAMGTIAAAPTAGSCGTLAGTLAAVAERVDGGVESMAQPVLAAGLIGVFIARAGGFAAEEGGCQYECGSASGMTAAALVELMGGDGQTAMNAASMAMQNTMGLICDPVADRVEVPCLGKNIMAALNAVAAANMALAGYAHVIPLGQVIQAMREVGEGMDKRFCCTCKGGLSTTPEARRIHASMNAATPSGLDTTRGG